MRNDPPMEEWLLKTKYIVPRMRNDLVVRERLFGLLDQAFSIPVTLVSAPAGFGKSTLAAGWIRDRGLSAAWVSLDENDNAPNRFFEYVDSAIRTAFPGRHTGIFAMLQTPEPVPARTIVSSLMNDIHSFPDPVIIVLDDYQFIIRSLCHFARKRKYGSFREG